MLPSDDICKFGEGRGIDLMEKNASAARAPKLKARELTCWERSLEELLPH